MSAQLDRYMQRNVPRYTSYPTAPHFTDAMRKEDYAAALGALDPDQPISLYLHVPFCKALCWYCGCNMKLAKREAPITQYAKTLRQEIALVARHLPARMKVEHLHWGGGTPTALAPDDLQGLMETVGAHFDFLPGAELAIESDPRTLSQAMIERIGALGFTRASFGVQEFDPQVQKAINRIQPPEMVARAVGALRAVGITGVNFDLIYGLPHQTVETLLETVSLCADMAPDRIALFGYAHVPWMAKKQRLIDESALPGPAARLAQARAAAEALEGFGYTAIGLDHFALPRDPLSVAARDGTLRRNFQGYTTDQAQTMLGFGATSIGRTPTTFTQNTTETGAWARAVEAGELPLARGVTLSADDQLRGAVIERLMCQGRVDLNAEAARFGLTRDYFRDAEAALDEFSHDGLITYEGGVVTARPSGLQLIRVIASAFDAYFQASAARHALAV